MMLTTNDEALKIVENILVESPDVPSATLSVNFYGNNPPESKYIRFVVKVGYIHSQNAETELAGRIQKALLASGYEFDVYTVESSAHMGGQMTMFYNSGIARDS